MKGNYKKFDGSFEAGKAHAHSVLKPTSKSMPKNRASLGTKEILKQVAKLPNAGK